MYVNNDSFFVFSPTMLRRVEDSEVPSSFLEAQLATGNLYEDPFAQIVIDIDEVENGLVFSHSFNYELFQNLAKMERTMCPKSNDYTAKRATCIGWLVHIATACNVPGEVLHLAVACLDRYLFVKGNDSGKMHLAGLACMILACKYEYPHSQRGIQAYFLRTTYFDASIKDVVAMEVEVCSCIGYRFATPTTWTFLTRYIHAAQYGGMCVLEGIDSAAKYIAEFSLFSSEMLRYRPSMVSAACIFLAKYILVPLMKPWIDMDRRLAVALKHMPPFIPDKAFQILFTECRYNPASIITHGSSLKLFHYNPPSPQCSSMPVTPPASATQQWLSPF